MLRNAQREKVPSMEGCPEGGVGRRAKGPYAEAFSPPRPDSAACALRNCSGMAMPCGHFGAQVPQSMQAFAGR